MKCPDCDAGMKLRSGKHGTFWGCVTFPECRGAISCNEDGTPKGTPGNAETRAARQEAHKVFDRLWKAGAVKGRGAAYHWLQEVMGMTADEAHIGQFDAAQCGKVVEFATARLAKVGLKT